MNATEFIIDRSEPEPNSGCWIWLRCVNPDGYGHTRCPETTKNDYGHRVSYKAFRGLIPPGLSIDHLCRNRQCVNPAHLEAVPLRTNILRSPYNPTAINASKTHCLKGHPLDDRRDCRICIRAYHKKYEDAHREQRNAARRKKP